ncbi:MAG TPA: TetR/AcrR family transcriptional regulator [Methanocella sp.]|jgi:AcrR family transcriptional regulator
MARITKDPEVRRNELMDVAERLFAEKGYDHTSPSDIIREAGVAQGTFYYYFKSRDDIVRAIIGRYLERYEQYIAKVADDQSLGAPEKLRLILDGLSDLSRQKSNLRKHVRDELWISAHEDYRGHVQTKVLPLVQRIVRQGVDEGFFKVEYPDETAEMLVVLNKYLREELKQLPDPDVCARKIEATRAVMEKALGAKKGTFRPRS